MGKLHLPFFVSRSSGGPTTRRPGGDLLGYALQMMGSVDRRARLPLGPLGEAVDELLALCEAGNLASASASGQHVAHRVEAGLRRGDEPRCP
jgi:hypothetical protein